MSGPLVALDLGGVMVDVAPLALRSNERPNDDGPHRQSTPNDDAVQHAFFGHPIDGVDEHRRVSVGVQSTEAWLTRAAERLGCPREDTLAAWRARLSLAPGSASLIEALVAHGVDVVLWSNTDPLHFETLAPWLPEDWCDPRRRALSYELGALKPDAAFFARALERAGASPALFVDDRPENVGAALRAGVPAVVARGPEEALEAVRRALPGALHPGFT